MAHSPLPHQITESTSPASVDPFVRALGPDRAVELFLVFGGSVLYLSEKPRVGARLLDIVGLDGVQALVREFGSGHVNVPLANAWIAQRLDERGVSRAEIARRLRVSRDRLRRYLPHQGNDRSAA